MRVSCCLLAGGQPPAWQLPVNRRVRTSNAAREASGAGLFLTQLRPGCKARLPVSAPHADGRAARRMLAACSALSHARRMARQAPRPPGGGGRQA